MSQLTQADTLLHCAPIWLLPAHLNELQRAGINRLLVFSSTSVVSKQSSDEPQERQLVDQLAAAESSLQSFCKRHDMALTIFRPSMVYGYGADQNIMRIAAFIRRFGWMILAGGAQGLRQPVHADDLVDAVLAAWNNDRTFGKIYNLAGAEQLTYRAMVERVFHGLGRKPRIISLPLPVYRFALRLAAIMTRFSYTAEMANRMSQNLVYDYQPAAQDFAFCPQPFLREPKRDLFAPE